MRLSLRAAGFLALAVVAITCTDAPTGPDSSGADVARKVQFQPRFSPEAAVSYVALAAAGIEVTEVHIHLTGADGTTRDTVIAFPVGQDQLTIEIPVSGASTDQQFNAVVELRNDQHTVLFSGTQTVTARPASLATTNPPTITIQYAGPGKDTKAVAVSPGDTTITATSTAPFRATAVDASGKAVTDLLVLWSTSDPTLATITQTTNSTATLAGTGRRGTVTISAKTPQGIIGTARLNLVPAPARLVLVSGNNQSAAAGSVLAQPLVVEVQAADNSTVAGVPVAFRAVTAGGAVQTASVLSDANGRASTGLTVGQAAGAYTYEASVAGVTAVITATGTATAGTGSAIAIVSGDQQSDSSGRTLAPLVVRVRDSFGNIVNGVAISWARFFGSGTLAGTTSATSTDGTASNFYTLGTTVGDDSVRASLPGTGGSVTFTLHTVSRRGATITILSGGGQSGTPGSTLPQGVVAKVSDAAGNAVAGATVTFAAPGTAFTVNPASAVTNAAGLATTSVTLGTTPGSYVLTAASGALGVTTNVNVVAGSAASIAKVAGDAQSATADAVVAIAPAVAVKDANGNAVAGVTVTFAIASGGGSVTGATATTSATGVATIGSWRLGTAAGTNTLTATAGSLSATFSATAVAASGSKFNLVQGLPATVAVGATVPPVKVQLADANGNPVAQAGVTVTLTLTYFSTGGPSPFTDRAAAGQRDSDSLSRGASVENNANTTVTATSDATGLVVFNPAAYTSTIGFWTTSVSAPGYNTLSVSGTTQLVAGQAQALSIVTQPSAAATSGLPFAQQPVIQLVDAGGNAVPTAGVTVSASLASGSAALSGTVSQQTNASGRAVFGTLGITGAAGARTILFSSPAGAPITSATVSVGAGAATAIAVSAGNTQTATAGSAVAVPPAVLVTDPSGNPVAGVSVTFAAATGGGSVTSATLTTGANGIATVGSWTLGAAAGSNTLTATAGSLVTTFSATGVAGSGSRISLVTGLPASLTNGVNPGTITARLADANNNPVAQSGVKIYATVAFQPLNQSHLADSAFTDATGAASFQPGVFSGPAPQTLLLTLSAAGFTSFTTPGIPTIVGAPAALAISQAPPTNVMLNQLLSPQPVIQVTDLGGNPVASSTNITASVTFGTLTGTATVATNGAGVATFTNLRVGGTPGIRGLKFNAPGLDSNFVDVTATIGSAQNFAAVGATTGTAVVGTTTYSPTVRVTDAFGNPVSSYSVTFTPRNGSLANGSSAPATVQTSVSGTASVNWILGNVAGTNADTVEATAGSLTGSPILFASSASAGGPNRVLIQTQTSATATSGSTLAPAPVVRIADAFGNTIASSSAQVTATLNGGGTFSGNTVETAANGVATFSSLQISAAAGNYSLTFASGTLLSATSNSITLGAGAASATTFSPAWVVSGTTPSGTAFGVQPSIQLRDAAGNNVSSQGVTVTATIASGPTGGAVQSATALTNSAGLATFSGLKIAGPAGTYTLLFTANGVAGTTTSQSLNVTAVASSISIDAGNGQTAIVNSNTATAPRVRVVDAFNAAVSGVGVTFVPRNGSRANGASGATTVNTDANGLASVTWTLGTLAGASMDTLVATATGLAGSPVTFAASALSGAASSATITAGNNVTATVGTATSPAPQVTVKDAFNNPVSGATVQFAAYNGSTFNGSAGNQLATTNASGEATGVWVLGPAAGTNVDTLRFTVSGVSGVGVFAASATSGAASQMTSVSGAGQTGAVNAILATAAEVHVTDAGGNPVAGTTILFTPKNGSKANGSTSPVSIVTDASGNAGVNWRLGTIASANADTLIASSSLTGSPIVYVATARSAAAARLNLLTPPGTPSTSGVVLSTQPVVSVTDTYGNLVDTLGLLVTVTTAETSTLVNAQATTVHGVATFSGFSIAGVVGQYNLRWNNAELGAPGEVTFGPVNLSAGTATALAIIQQPPATAGSGITLTTSPTVQLRDASGNAVQTSGVLVTAALASGTGTIGGTVTATTNSSGLATFSNLNIVGIGAYTLRFTSGALTSVTSASIATSAVASRVTITTQPPASAVSGAALSPNPVIQIVDGSGNAISGVYSVTATVIAGGGTASGTTTISTNAAGLGTFTNLAISTLGVQTLRFTSGTLLSVTANPVTITPGAAFSVSATTSSHLLVLPRNTVSLQYTVKDANGNALGAGTSVSFVAGTNAGCSSSASANTNASGVATASVYVDTLRAGCEVTASVNGHEGIIMIANKPYSGSSQATHVWFGGTSGSEHGFTTAANWVRVSDLSANAPGSSGDIPYIPYFANGYHPELSATRTVAALTMDDSAYFDLTGNVLTVSGNVKTNSGAVVNGTVKSTGHNVNVSGILPILQLGQSGSCSGGSGGIANLIGTVADTIVVACTALVNDAYTHYTRGLAGSFLNVTGNGSRESYSFSTDSMGFVGDSVFIAHDSRVYVGDAVLGGRLLMGYQSSLDGGDLRFTGKGTNSYGDISARGNVTFGGTGSLGYYFGGGSLSLGGDFRALATGTGPAFTATSYYTTTFEGSSPQSIALDDTASSYFGNIYFANPTTVTFSTSSVQPYDEGNPRSIYIDQGQMIVPANKTVRVNGDFTAAGYGTSALVDGNLFINSCTYYDSAPFTGSGRINGNDVYYYSCGYGGSYRRSGRPAASIVSQSRATTQSPLEVLKARAERSRARIHR